MPTCLTLHNSTATNQLIIAKDHASVQINIGHLDENGIFNNETTTVAFSGFLRKKARSDHSLNVVAAENGLIRNVEEFPGSHKYE